MSRSIGTRRGFALAVALAGVLAAAVARAEGAEATWVVRPDVVADGVESKRTREAAPAEVRSGERAEPARAADEGPREHRARFVPAEGRGEPKR